MIKISKDFRQWENTPANIILRAGDKLVVPKEPDFILVSGQVYNTTGITYRPGKDAAWHLDQAGGATRYGDKGQIFILRADGSVAGNTKSTLFSPGVLSTRMHPGDAIIVPEKVVGGSILWRNLIGTAQVISSVAITGAVTGDSLIGLTMFRVPDKKIGKPSPLKAISKLTSRQRKWENVLADCEMQAGDTKFRPGRSLDWYLKKSGGAARTGDKKHLYVLRADGSVFIPQNQQTIWMGGAFSNVRK